MRQKYLLESLTLLTAPDFVTDKERQYILNVVPGEGSRPEYIQK